MNILTYEMLKQQSNNYKPSDLAAKLGFNKALDLARQMINNEEWDETLHQFAAHLLEELKVKYSKEWNSSWKYNAFLGYVYDITLEYDKRYASYRNAFNQVCPTPPELLIALARCYWAPGDSPITEEESIALVKQAMQNKIYVEGAELLKGLYKSIGNHKEQAYWANVLNDIQEKGPHLLSLDKILDE